MSARIVDACAVNHEHGRQCEIVDGVYHHGDTGLALQQKLDDEFRSAFPPNPERSFPPTTLVGEEQAAYSAFCTAAQALEQHQRDGVTILQTYKDALGKLSALAAKRS